MPTWLLVRMRDIERLKHRPVDNPQGNRQEYNRNSSFPVFLNCSRESREVPEFIVPTLIEKNTNFFG